MRQDLGEIKKVLDKHGYAINTIICEVMKKFKFKTLCHKVGVIIKSSGYNEVEIITLLAIFPLMVLKSVHSLYKSQYATLAEMKKDVIYRLQNNEKMPWRRLLYEVCKKYKELTDKGTEIAPNSAFIIDDTIHCKEGTRIENVSIVHDHASGKDVYKLGFKDMFLGLFDGKSIIPLDFSIHAEKQLAPNKRRKQFKKLCDARSNGGKRRKECKEKKNKNALIMIKRAIKNGFMARYVLMDSWYSSLEVIKAIREIKNGIIHVVCGIKRDFRKYEYKGYKLNAKEIIVRQRQEGKEKRCRRWNTRYFEVVVNYPGIGNVKLYICRFPYQKEWRMFLSTNTALSFIEMMEQYAIRWTIEVFFKEAKQYLLLEKCQSRDFDAQIATITIKCILYVYLSYYRRINAYETLGELFSVIKDELCEKNLAQRIWELFDELLQVVINAITKSGTVDIKRFKQSREYQYLKGLFETSFLSNQILGVNST